MKNFARKAFLLSVALTGFVLFSPETRAENIIINSHTVLDKAKELMPGDTLQFIQNGDIYAPNVTTTTDISSTVIAIKAGGDLNITFADTADPYDADGENITARIYAKNTTFGNTAIAIDLGSSDLNLTNNGPAGQTIFAKSVPPNEGETMDKGAIAIRTNSNSILSFAENGVTLKADARNFYQDPPGTAVGSSEANLIGDCFGLHATGGLTISNLEATFINNNYLESLASAESYAGANILGIAASASICDSEVKSVTVTYGENNELFSIASAQISTGASGANIVGAGFGNLGTSKNLSISDMTATFGSGNNLVSCAIGFDSAANVIGVAVGGNSGGEVSLNKIAATFGSGNNLVSYAEGTHSAAGVIGLAIGENEKLFPVNDVTMNFNGSQTIAALAYSNNDDKANAKVNVFGADCPCKNWRIGIYADGVTTDSTINILGAKLENAITIGIDPAKAQIFLGDDQGSSCANYARAITLGENSWYCFGQKLDVDGVNFTQVPRVGGHVNTANILGAISRGVDSASTAGGGLIVDSGWKVNAFGPVEHVEKIIVKNNSTFNTYNHLSNVTVSSIDNSTAGTGIYTYGPLANVTIDGGNVYAYGTSTGGAGKIEVKNGVLHLGTSAAAANPETAFNTAVASIDSKMKFRNPHNIDDTNLYEVTINTSNYQWKPASVATSSGKLTLNEDDRLVIHVDDSIKQDDLGTTLKHASGYVFIDNNNSTITFNGGKILIANDSKTEAKVENSSYLTILAPEKVGGTDLNLAGLLGIGNEHLSDINAEDIAILGMGDPLDEGLTLTIQKVTGLNLIDSGVEGCDAITYYVKGASSGGSKYNALVAAIPQSEIEEVKTSTCDNSEVAHITMDSTSLIQNPIIDRMARVKGCVSDPFVYFIGGHSHQNEVAGFGHKSNMYGFTLGADHVFNFGAERYLRVGAAFGYVKADTDFFGTSVDKSKTAKHDNYRVMLFGAYETFNEKHLKANFNAVFGLGNCDSKLHRVDANSNAFNAKMKSNNIFFNVEFVKNLYARKGFNFGLWLGTNYNHIKQNDYTESPNRVGAKHVSKIDYNFLNTIVGLNIEKEIGSMRPDSKLKLLCRIGWDCQPVRKHSDVYVTIPNTAVGKFTPILGQPSKNSAIVMASFTKTLNRNWNFAGAWVGHFSKNATNNAVSCGVEYNF